jgi:transglutaminase-like putative cysteine protease
MAYASARTVRMAYCFVNRHPGPVEVWLALPPELPTQRSVRVCDLTPEPISVQPDGNGINRLAFFELAPGESLRFTVQAELYRAACDPSAPGADATLDATARANYLRSSALIRVTEEVRAEALHIVAGATTPLEQARRLYIHLIKHYQYKWPPPARGSESMRRNRRGDCGEYSFLYAAWCRALGIPCRVMVGTFAHGRMRAHVWNEVFIDGIGWMPADSSIYQTPLRLPVLADLDWALQRIHTRFGQLAADRLVFSIDPDVPLQPPYQDRTAPATYERISMGGRPLAWGFESLDGAAPYLQPIYIRLGQARDIAPSGALEGILTAIWPPLAFQTAALYLGDWRFADPLSRRLGTWLGLGGVAIGALSTLLAQFDIDVLHLPGTVGYVAFMVWLIRFSGMRWWKLALLLLQALSLVVAVLRLLAL